MPAIRELRAVLRLSNERYSIDCCCLVASCASTCKRRRAPARLSSAVAQDPRTYRKLYLWVSGVENIDPQFTKAHIENIIRRSAGDPVDHRSHVLTMSIRDTRLTRLTIRDSRLCAPLIGNRADAPALVQNVKHSFSDTFKV
jgi:hypothetical protein